jgi:hypothetical protein
MKLPISNIVILQRARKNAGDITALERSIQELGLLHPVVVTPDFALIAGYRRILAAKELGWTNIDVRVVESLTDAASELKAERDENTCRKDFCPSEAVALGERLEALERPKAKERQAAAGPKEGKGKKKSGSAETAEAVGSGETRDIVAASVGMGRTAYQQAKAVIQAAKENPPLRPRCPRDALKTHSSPAPCQDTPCPNKARQRPPACAARPQTRRFPTFSANRRTASGHQLG